MFRQFSRLAYAEFRIFLREPVAVFFNIFFPLMFLFLAMHVFTPQNAIDSGIVNYYIPSFLVVTATGVSLFNIPIYIVKYRNVKFLKRLKVAPIKPFVVLTSLGMANLFLLLIGFIVVILVGIFIYNATFTGNLFLFSAGLLLSFVSLASLGLLLSSIIRGLRTVNVVGQLVYYPMFFLSGAFPFHLPKALDITAKVIPTTYAVDLMQRLWSPSYYEHIIQIKNYQPSIGLDVLVLSIYLVAGILISVKFFKWE